MRSNKQQEIVATFIGLLQRVLVALYTIKVLKVGTPEYFIETVLKLEQYKYKYKSLFGIKHNTMFITNRHNQNTVKPMKLHAVYRRA